MTKYELSIENKEENPTLVKRFDYAEVTIPVHNIFRKYNQNNQDLEETVDALDPQWGREEVIKAVEYWEEDEERVHMLEDRINSFEWEENDSLQGSNNWSDDTGEDFLETAENILERKGDPKARYVLETNPSDRYRDEGAERHLEFNEDARIIVGRENLGEKLYVTFEIGDEYQTELRAGRDNIEEAIDEAYKHMKWGLSQKGLNNG